MTFDIELQAVLKEFRNLMMKLHPDIMQRLGLDKVRFARTSFLNRPNSIGRVT